MVLLEQHLSDSTNTYNPIAPLGSSASKISSALSSLSIHGTSVSTRNIGEVISRVLGEYFRMAAQKTTMMKMVMASYPTGTKHQFTIPVKKPYNSIYKQQTVWRCQSIQYRILSRSQYDSFQFFHRWLILPVIHRVHLQPMLNVS